MLTHGVGANAARLSAMIQGAWSCLLCENDGKVIPDEMRGKLRLTLTDTIYQTTAGDQLLFEGQYRLNDQVQPPEIDILATSGPLAGQSALGIYERTGDELKLAYVMPGKPRPREFRSPAGSGVANTTWRLID
jgi:uncharacterized protein (TIGR03067 family)